MTNHEALKFLRLPAGSSREEIVSAIGRAESNLSKRLTGELTSEDRSRYEQMAGQLKEARAALLGDDAVQNTQTDDDGQPDSLRVSR